MMIPSIEIGVQEGGETAFGEQTIRSTLATLGILVVMAVVWVVLVEQIKFAYERSSCCFLPHFPICDTGIMIIFTPIGSFESCD